MSLVHGTEATERVEHAAAALFGEEVAGLDEATILDVFADAPSTMLDRARLEEGVPLVDLLCEVGLVASKTRARTTVEQGGASVNNRREDDVNRVIGRDDLVDGGYVVLRRGKREFHLVRFA